MNEKNIYHVIGGDYDEDLQRELEPDELRVKQVVGIETTLTPEPTIKMFECIDWFQVGDNRMMHTVYLLRVL